MTYDERREIDEYLNIVKKNTERLLHSIELMRGAVDEMKYTFEKEEHETKKENFLKHY